MIEGERHFSHGPLTGVRIIDLTSVVMGPLAMHILADLGADVIKVEGPEGDSLRSHQPARSPGMSSMFLQLNRNKRSVVLDLKKDDGAKALRRLIESADVFVHSMRPDTITRIGFDYQQVARIKPDIVYCGAHGFGSRGPYSRKAAYDDVIQAGSGLASLANRLGQPATYLPTIICDKVTGQAIAYTVLAALVRKLQGGGGANIEVPMFETCIAFNLVEHVGGSLFVPCEGDMGYPRLFAKSRKPFRTADGYACILPYSKQNWIDFLTLVGRPEIMDDPRFETLAGRVAAIDELNEFVTAAAPSRTNSEWAAFCDATSIPFMPVLALEELADDVHVQAVGLFEEHEHPTEGRYRAARPATTIDEQPFVLRRHAPRLGEHTAEILAELDLCKKATDLQ